VLNKAVNSDNENPQFALTWFQICQLADGMEWSRLKFEVSRKLDEDEIKLERMKIPIDFEDLGFRILQLAATSNPQGTWEQRLNTLEERAAELLEGRHMLLPHVQKCSERLQALLAINTSSAWAEFASVMRLELSRPRWALEAAAIALEKDPSNEAALTVSIAANGEIGEFALAHHAYAQSKRLNPKSNHASNAIAKVELREGKFDDAVKDAMRAFVAQPNAATARLIGNIYRGAGMNDTAYRWYADAENIDGPNKESVTTAHVHGLILLAKEAIKALPDNQAVSES
jgi:tetratricopeptide (TPR) repeat protein